MDSAGARDALSSRIIPTMKLSSADNPLTAVLPSNSNSDPHARVLSRFKVEGNAIVTGGAGALGLISTRALLEHGLSSVCLFDLERTFVTSKADIEKLRVDFPDHKISTYAADVTSPEAVEELTRRAVTEMGGLHVLCCFAGIVGCVDSVSASAGQFRSVIDVNLTGSFLCAQAAAKAMIEQKTGGSILFTASISAHQTNFPQPQVAYNVSKAGVAHLTRNLATEWAVHGIRVNSISPGYMDTVLNAGDNLATIRDSWASHCPMGRMGDVEEVTGAVVLLSSKRAGRYITGADILVDGGAMCM